MSVGRREKVGRNDPCPCGSGKKYKHCCLAASAPSQDTIWTRHRHATYQLTRDIMRFAALRFANEIDAAWRDFNMGETPGELEEFPDERQIFMPYYLYHWDPLVHPPGEQPPAGVIARAYMEEKSQQLSPTEHMLLEQATTQPLSFYEVVQSRPGEGLLLKDLLIGGETEVIEHSASRELRAGDLVYGQIWDEQEFKTLGSSAPVVIPPSEKVVIIRLRQDLRKKVARERRNLTRDDLARHASFIRSTYLEIRDVLRRPPQLANTDGDPLLFHTLTFQIGSADAAFEAVASLAVGCSREELLDEAERGPDGKLRSVTIDWIREGNRRMKSWENTILGHIKISEGRLVAEVNSEKRARRLRKEIEERLGSRAVHQGTLAHTVEELVKTAPKEKSRKDEDREAEFQAILRDPEVQRQIQAKLQKQMEQWVHEKLPALDGRTPLEAVRDPDGREMVEALLLDWERRDQEHDAPGDIRPDIGAIRRLLNLPRAS